MAGIGFQLHKLLEDESFLKKAKAYIYASIITSGPWILSIICLALIGLITSTFFKSNEFSHVSITIVYTFAFSLILTGPIQFALTRYLADKEFLKQKEKMFSSLLSALLLTLIVSLCATIPWYYYSKINFSHKIIGIILFVIVSSIWTMMDFLSCSKNYSGIISAFFMGTILSLIAAPIMGNYFSTIGALSGYTLGQAFILFFLLYYIKKEFPYNGIINTEYFRYFKLHPYIFLTGLFYNLGLWIDKFLAWLFLGSYIFGNFKAYDIYDTPIFIAYLSIIPSLAYFLIQSETKFYLVHRKFFDSITNESLDKILLYKKNLIIRLKKSILNLGIVQLITSTLGAFFSKNIIDFFGLPDLSIPILRILFFAAGFQVMFLYVIIFLMYFDMSKISFYLVLTFFITNISFNFILIKFPYLLPGSGYLLSIVTCFISGCILLLYLTRDIEYKIFMKQGD